MKKILLIIAFVVSLLSQSFSQVVYQHIAYEEIYEFLDEMANLHIVSINSVVKPFSRKYIAQKLFEIESNKNKLNSRQQKELLFFLKEYREEHMSKDSIGEKIRRLWFWNNTLTQKNRMFYRDSLFVFSVKSIIGSHAFANGNDTVIHRWVGAEAFGYAGKFGFYVSLRDNSESSQLAKEEYLTRRKGGPYKGMEYSDTRGGITYDWQWGVIGLIKDDFSWGNNYHGANIFSGHAPSFTQLQFHIKPADWFEFRYVHGWLNSDVIDSNAIYNFGYGNRTVVRPKHLAANLFSVYPIKRLCISFGNSIVYSDVGGNPAYFLPLSFFKSIDHSLNGRSNYTGQNAQMFLDISSRQIKKVHLYSTFFLDELSISRIKDDDMPSATFSSIKIGARLSNILPNISFTTEYTRTNPATFKHFVNTTTFESNRYNLGHYLRDNSQELYCAVDYRPLRGLKVNLAWNHAIKAGDYEYTGIGYAVIYHEFMDVSNWSNNCFSVKISHEFANEAYVFGGFKYSEIHDKYERYTPDFLLGNNKTYSFGVNFGF